MKNIYIIFLSYLAQFLLSSQVAMLHNFFVLSSKFSLLIVNLCPNLTSVSVLQNVYKIFVELYQSTCLLTETVFHLLIETVSIIYTDRDS